MNDPINNNSESTDAQASDGRVLIGNVGDPIRFVGATQLAGVAAATALEGTSVQVLTRLELTSDDPAFHRIAEGLVQVIRQEAAKSQVPCPALDAARTLLYIVRGDQSAELWVDTAAVTLSCVVKRSMKAMTVIFENDLADVLAMRFPKVEMGPTDRVLCIFREGWRFGLVFDFRQDGHVDVEAFSRSLGRLYRRLRYHQIYMATETPETFDKMCAAGWFPFVEIVTSQFGPLLEHIRSDLPLDGPEATLVGSFDDARLAHLYDRWMTKPHLAKRALILKEALDAFLGARPVTVIKILITEIEGFLSDAHREATGEPAKAKAALRFAIDRAHARTGNEETLMLPAAFAGYLDRYTFATFDPLAGDGTAGSRHAVGHGAASQETYTMARALQLILTVDQLAFYT